MVHPKSRVFTSALLAWIVSSCSGTPETGTQATGGGAGSGGSFAPGGASGFGGGGVGAATQGGAGGSIAGASAGGGVTAGNSNGGNAGAGGESGSGASGGESGGGAGSSAGRAGGAGGTGGGNGGGGGGGNGGGGGGGNGGGGNGGGGGSAGGTSEPVHFYGRWNRLTDRAITVNSGSHVVAQFLGTGVSARFDTSLNQTPNPTLAWRVDDGTWQERELSATVSLATGLSAGTHEVLLMVRGLNENQNRWSPPLVSSITFLGFDVTGGAVQASPRPARPKIEFLGDSITEGVALFTSYNGQTTPCWRADGRRAYASVTAQALSAEWRQVGFGRQGLLIGGNGGVPIANNAFNWIYQDVARDAWQPDLVVVNQGTNDGNASAATFRPAYGTLIGTIRTAYSGAKIAAMRPFNGAHAAEISAEVDARRAAGDTRVYYVNTSGWLVNADFTDGVHPNEAGSQKAATALTTAIRAIGLP
jgi:lysophospholipase L1-like esterase